MIIALRLSVVTPSFFPVELTIINLKEEERRGGGEREKERERGREWGREGGRVEDSTSTLDSGNAEGQDVKDPTLESKPRVSILGSKPRVYPLTCNAG